LAQSSAVPASSKSIALIAVVLVIAALYLGRQILIPLALAFVLSFLLSPVVGFLERIRLGRVPSVVIVLVLSFALLGTVSWTVARQLVQIMDDLPSYKANLDAKIKLLHAPRNATLSKATATVQELNRELSAVPEELSAEKSQQNSKASHPVRPIPVQVAAPPSSFIEDLRELLGPLAEPMETAAMAVIFTLFMLAKREDLRNRAIRLAGHGKLNLMTQALDDATRRLSRYLLLQFLVNATYGLVFGLALHFLGVPNALLWGVFAGILRFVPYLGALIAVALPVMMALAVFPGWHQAGMTLGIFLVLELAVSNVVEPLLYGAHTGISSLAILVAAVFWATLWGPVGLILSTPLTVCLIVLGRHVPQLNFLEVVLGDEPVLPPQQCFYQRVLAADPEEARAIAESFLKENSLESLYGSVLLPALKLAEQDRSADRLDDSRLDFTLQTVRELVDDLGEQNEENTLQPEPRPSEPRPLEPRSEPRLSKQKVACVAAGVGPDELVTTMLVQLLHRAGHEAVAVRASAVENAPAALGDDTSVVCISSISPFSVGQVRSLCRKLRANSPEIEIIIGLWNFEIAAGRQRLGPGCPGSVVTSLSDALSQIHKVQVDQVEVDQVPEPNPVDESLEVASDKEQNIPV
jgi:predicted PurR-regulated permease PerM